MEKKALRYKKLKRTLTTFFILFLLGLIIWPIVNVTIAQRIHRDGILYGSGYSPLVLSFQADTKRDFWKISFTTTDVQGTFNVEVYEMSGCQYDAFMQGYGPQGIHYGSYSRYDLKLKPSYSYDCDSNLEIYLVWIIGDCTIKVTYDSTKVYFHSLSGYYIYLSLGLVMFCVLYILLYRSKTTTLPKSLQYCAICGIKLKKGAEFCPHCGKIYHSPDVTKLNTEKES